MFFHFHRSAASIFLFRADWLQVDELILDGCAVSTRPWITPRHQAPICQNRSKRIGCGANLLEILRVRESQCATTTCLMVPRNNCCITKDRSQHIPCGINLLTVPDLLGELEEQQRHSLWHRSAERS